MDGKGWWREKGNYPKKKKKHMITENHMKFIPKLYEISIKNTPKIIVKHPKTYVPTLKHMKHPKRKHKKGFRVYI